jgi:uncharacterized protein (TIGR02147 family)
VYTVALPRPIFDYDDYRDVIRDWIRAEKAASRVFSYRFLARKLGLSAPNHLQLVATRQRNLSRATFAKLRPLLKLKPRERTFFELLFELQTTPEEEGDAVRARLARLRAAAESDGSGDDPLAVLTNTVAWYLLAGAPLFDGLPRDELAARACAAARFPVTVADLDAAIAFLERIGRASVREGRVFFAAEHVRTGWDLDRTEVKQFHRAGLRLALQSVAWPPSDRFLSNVTFLADAELVETAKREIRDLCLRLLEASDRLQAGGEGRQVVALQLAMFPFFGASSPRSDPQT